MTSNVWACTRRFIGVGLCCCVVACGGQSLFTAISTELSNPLTVTVNAATQRAYIVNANDTALYTSGSLHILDLSTITAPARVASQSIDSLGGQIVLDVANNRVVIPNRLSENDTDATDHMVEVNISEGGASFLNVASIDANGNPFGAVRDAATGRLLVPTREGTLDVFDLGAVPLVRAAQVELKRTLSDGSDLSIADAVEILLTTGNTQAVVTRASGGLFVLNLGELTTAGVNPVDYFISDLESPRGLATDGTLVYVVDTVDNDGTTENYLRVLDLRGLAVDGSNTTTTLQTLSANSLQAAALTVGTDPQQVVVSAGLARAYVTNMGANTVSVFDTAARTKITDITVGESPFGMALYQQVAAGPDTHLIVCNRQSNTISILDLATNTVVATYP